MQSGRGILVKTIKYLSLLLLILFVFSSCNANPSINQEVTFRPDASQSFYALSETWDSLGLWEPSSFEYHDSLLYIADSKNNQIMTLDTSGNISAAWGRAGNGIGEFSNPTAVSVVDSEIIVGDSGNRRCVILNKNGEFLDSFDIDVNERTDFIIDSILRLKDSYHIALAPFSTFNGHNIIKYANDKLSDIEKNNSLHIEPYQSGYFAAQELMYSKTMDAETFESGETALYFYNGNMERLFNFPYKYMPKAIRIKDDMIYAYSGAFGSVDCFNQSGDFIGSLVEVMDLPNPPGSPTDIVDFDFDERGALYILNSAKGCIYKFSEEAHIP